MIADALSYDKTNEQVAATSITETQDWKRKCCQQGCLAYPPDPGRPSDLAGEANNKRCEDTDRATTTIKVNKRSYLFQPVKLVVLRHVAAHTVATHRVLNGLRLHKLLRH